MAVRSAFDIRMLGDKQLEQKLGELEVINQRKVMRKAQREAFKPLLKTVKSRAPKGKTGKLRKFIKLRALKRSRVRSGVYIRTGTRDEMGLPKAAEGKNVDEKGRKLWYYPAHIETGYTTSSGRVVPPNPYLRGAFDGMKDRVWRKFHVTLWRGVKDLWVSPRKLPLPRYLRRGA